MAGNKGSWSAPLESGRRKFFRVAAATTLASSSIALLLAACGSNDDGTPLADLILQNGQVYTVDANRTKAQAVAVREGKIIYVGSNEGLAKFKGSNTKVVDLKGRMLLPGFVDTHNHAYLRAEAMFWVNLSTATLDAYKQATQAFIAQHGDAKQIRGVGWNLNYVLQEAAASGRSPSQLLDDIVGKDVPAVFITNGHHEIWANTRAMQNAGIGKDTPNPPGAFIDRNPATGEPTGILREFGAQNMVISKLPQPDFSVNEFQLAILSFQQDLAPQRGVTSVLVPTHYPTDSFLDAIQALDNENKLTVRYDVLLWADETRGTAQIPEFVARRAKYKGKFFKVDSIKIFGTGASSTFGSVVWDQDVLNKTVAALDKENFRVYIHDIGPTSTYDLMLDAFGYALQQNGKRDARHAITHVSAAASPSVARFKALGVRADGHPLPKAFFDAGVAATSSSDYPVRDFFPMTRVASGVTSGISLDAMIASHTINGAEMIFAEKETGSIEVGKAGDFVVLNKNLFEVPAAEIGSAKTMMTIFNGKEVFRDPSF